VEEEFIGDVKKEGRMVLWTNSTTRYEVVGAGMAQQERGVVNRRSGEPSKY